MQKIKKKRANKKNDSGLINNTMPFLEEISVKSSSITKTNKEESKKRGRIIGVRVSQGEYHEIQKMAETEGLSVASYIRQVVLAVEETQRTLKPSFDRVLLAQTLEQSGKIESHLNLIAMRLAKGKGVGLERLCAALDDLTILKNKMLDVLKN